MASPTRGQVAFSLHWTAESKWAFSVINASRAENKAACSCNFTGNQRDILLCMAWNNNYKLTCCCCSTGKAMGALIDVSDDPVKSKMLI